jgi:hypothetical protein
MEQTKAGIKIAKLGSEHKTFIVYEKRRNERYPIH